MPGAERFQTARTSGPYTLRYRAERAIERADVRQRPDARLRRARPEGRRGAVRALRLARLRPRHRDAGKRCDGTGPRPGHVLEALAERRALRRPPRTARDVGPARRAE